MWSSGKRRPIVRSLLSNVMHAIVVFFFSVDQPRAWLLLGPELQHLLHAVAKAAQPGQSGAVPHRMLLSHGHAAAVVEMVSSIGHAAPMKHAWRKDEGPRRPCTCFCQF